MPLSPGIKVTLVGAAANLFLSAIKFAGGWLGMSTALIADAVHSLSDLVTDFVVLAAHKIGMIPADDDHPYGHGRAETLGATLVGILIILAAVGIGLEAWDVMQSGSDRIPTWVAAAAAVVSILVKEGLFHYTVRVGEKTGSPSVVANAWHHRSDAISSVAALVGIGGALMGYPILDPLAGIVVALLILKVGIEIFLGGFRDLMDTGLSEEKIRRIQEVIDGIPEVIRYHDLRTRRVGGEIMMDVHIQVDHDLTVTEGHTIAERVRRNLIKNFSKIQDVLVHVDAEPDDAVQTVFPATREDLKSSIDAGLEPENGWLEKTGMRVHHIKGKTIVDLYVRVDNLLDPQELKSRFDRIKERLKESDKIDTVKFYLDVN